MGLFNLFGKPSLKINDITWMSQAAKMEGVLEFVSQHPNVNLVAWSTLTKERFEKYLGEAMGMPIEVALAHRVGSLSFRGESVYLLERHLFFSPENDLIHSWEPASVTFFNSMDDPVFEPAMSSRMIHLMDKLGMEENESLEHKMITKSIQNVQKEFEETVEVGALPLEVKKWFDTFGYS